MGRAPNTPADPPAALRHDQACRRLLQSWRRLAGGPVRTLVACSAGADSSALAIALAAGKAPIVVAHVVHDFRPPEQAHADRDAAARLAGLLNAPFAEASVRARPLGGNLEATSRRLRYAALARLAAAHGCACIATAHHAGDQLETMLMRLVRGAGPAGLAGIRPRLLLRVAGVEPPARLIRPMLGLTRADAERICALAGWSWRVDSTNDDTSRLRSAVRQGPAALLEALAPGAEARAAHAAELLRDAAGLVRDAADELVAAGRVDDPASATPRYDWPRARLREQRAVVVGEVLRRAAGLIRGPRGLDRLGGRSVHQAVRAVRSGGTDPKQFTWGSVEILVRADRVRVHALDQGPAKDGGTHGDRAG